MFRCAKCKGPKLPTEKICQDCQRFVMSKAKKRPMIENQSHVVAVLTDERRSELRELRS